jgi:arginine repressor
VSSATQERTVPVAAPAVLVDAGEPPLGRVLHGLVRHVVTADDLVVLTTAPGGAPTVAAAIERARIAPILATVAGDATVLTRTRSTIAAGVVARYLTAVAEVRSVRPAGAAGDEERTGTPGAPAEETR